MDPGQYHADGSRKSKDCMRAEVEQAAGERKRSYVELQQQVQEAGGTVRVREAGKRRRCTAAELQVQLQRLEGQRKGMQGTAVS